MSAAKRRSLVFQSKNEKAEIRPSPLKLSCQFLFGM